VQRQRDLPLHRHLVDRTVARGLHPVVGDAVDACPRDHVRIKRVEENIELRLIQITVVLDTGCFLNAVGVVQHHA
jgi:hypothetical protein